MDVAPHPRVTASDSEPDRFGRPHCPKLSPGALLDQLSAQHEELQTQNTQLIEAQAIAQQALIEYTDLYDFAPVPFVTLTREGMFSRMNRAAEDLLATGRDRVMGLPFRAFFRGANAAAFREHLRRCRAGEPSVKTELTLTRGNGCTSPVELVSRRDVAGDGYSTVILDLTERKQAEARTAELTRSLERRTSEAEQYATRLRALAAKLTEAENAERRRLARNLHDNLQQELIAAKYSVAVARGRADAAASLDDTEAALDRSLDIARRITADLTPPPLQQGAGLPAALRWLGDQTHSRHGLNVAVSVTDDCEPAVDAIRTMLYEVARELLLNVVKHAGTNAASVTLGRTGPGRLRLVVADEGRGFELAELLSRADEVSGLGLFGLRERVENLGGVVEIRSGPGNGTAVTVEVPDVRETPDPRSARDGIPR